MKVLVLWQVVVGPHQKSHLGGRHQKVQGCMSQYVCFVTRSSFRSAQSHEKNLTQAVQLRADQRLRECAIQKGDANIIAVTSRDIVAAEAHYHNSCYKNYTSGQAEDSELKDTNEKVIETDEYELYQRIEGDAYEDLFTYIRNEIIPNKEIVPVTSLT